MAWCVWVMVIFRDECSWMEVLGKAMPHPAANGLATGSVRDQWKGRVSDQAADRLRSG